MSDCTKKSLKFLPDLIHTVTAPGRMLVSLGVHVLAVDYRSYGDSSRVALTEASVVEDGRAALAWVEARVAPQAQVILWGHSLGTAIATRYLR